MRQAGIVAAAGLYALDHNVERLADDHANARGLAERLADAGLPVDLEQVETNFVLVHPGRVCLDAGDALGRLRAEGVLLSYATDRGVLRAVTHHDVSHDDVERAAEGIIRVLSRERGPVAVGDAPAPTPY
jgi:threonine aldolase